MHLGASRIGRPSPAMIVAIIALIASLSGSAYAALGKNSVGSRQLKAQSITTGKIANNAVNGRKVANGSLSGEDINLAALGTVPQATQASKAGNADTVSGHAAACPGATTLIRGTCFDSSSNAVASTVEEAADKCAAKGGRLPDPLELYATRNILNLGTGVGTDSQYTSAYYANASGSDYNTIVVNGVSTPTEQEITSDARYICAYELVR
jgi:hypothetical protein